MRISDWSSDVCSSDLLEFLLGAQLNAEIADLALAALAVLAGAIRTLVDRRIGPTPDVFAHPAVELVLGAVALRHVSHPSICWTAPVAAFQPGIAPQEQISCAATASPGYGANTRRGAHSRADREIKPCDHSSPALSVHRAACAPGEDRKSTRLNSSH